MANDQKAYVVELDGERYIGFPLEDAWKLYEVCGRKDEFKITYKEPKILGETHFVEFRS